MVEAGRQHTMTKGTIPVSAANTATRTGKAGPAGGVIQHAHISKLLGTGSSHPVHFKKEVMMDEIFTIVYVALLKKKARERVWIGYLQRIEWPIGYLSLDNHCQANFVCTTGTSTYPRRPARCCELDRSPMCKFTNPSRCAGHHPSFSVRDVLQSVVYPPQVH